MDFLKQFITPLKALDLSDASIDQQMRDQIKKLTSQISQIDDLASSWMSKLRPVIDDRSLEEICIPRTHDAAMYEVTSYRRLGSSSTVITQTRDIFSQLSFGVRMFDLRPCISKGQFFCGHYQYIKESDVPPAIRMMAGTIHPELIGHYHGAEGASLNSIIDQINKFTETHNEVIILEISHTFNFDREVKGSEWGHELNQDEWNRLLGELRRLNHLYISNDGANTEITKIKMKNLIADHSAVIVTTHRAGGVILQPEFAGKGFFEPAVLNPLNQTHLTREQTIVEVICAYIFDTISPTLAKTIAFLAGGDDVFLKAGLFSIIAVAQTRKEGELGNAIAKASADQYTNVVSMDNVDDMALLNAVLFVLGRTITGRDVELRLGGDNQWSFMPKQ